MDATTFLSDEEVATLTGFKTKSKQVQYLRKIGIPFFVNAKNKPIVCRENLHTPKEPPKPIPQWQACGVLLKNILSVLVVKPLICHPLFEQE